MTAIALTDDARTRLSRYLDRVRSALAGSGVDTDDVLSDVREHVDAALAGVPEPVDAEQVGGVLNRLGPPDRWVPREDRPMWPGIFATLRSGPEDWRLAYVIIFAFAVAFLFPPLFVVPFLLARAWLALSPESEERSAAVKAQRWLVYPALLIILLPLAGLLLAWPVPVAGAGAQVWIQQSNPSFSPAGSEIFTRLAPYSTLALGLWWSILGLIAALWPRLPRIVFRPFLDRFARRHATILIVVGLVIAIAGGAWLLF